MKPPIRCFEFEVVSIENTCFEFKAHGFGRDLRHTTSNSKYDAGVTTGRIDLGDVEAPDPVQLAAYFALSEAGSLLQHRIEQHLRGEGLSTVQFQLLTQLAAADTPLTMTQLADGVVYSRSGLTYQAGLLEKAGLIERRPSPDDERSALVAITDQGAALVNRVLPGHIEVVRRLLFEPLSEQDIARLGEIMTRVRDHMRR